MLMYSQPTDIFYVCQGLLLPYAMILGIVLNKKEYYITCQGHAVSLGGGGEGGFRETAHLALALVSVRHFCNDCGPILLKHSVANLHPDIVEPFFSVM
jgi:hypothetical protein